MLYLYIHTYMGSYFAHLSILPFLFSHKFYYRRSVIEKRVLLYPESRSVRRNTRQALDPPWSIHILKGHTDNPQVPAILPARGWMLCDPAIFVLHLGIVCRLFVG